MNGRVGVIATRGTVASGAYGRELAGLSSKAELFPQAAPLLVPLAEEGWLEGAVPTEVVEHYLEPLAVAGVDTLILGCTHYPLLADVIRSVAARVLSPEVQVVDSAHATASELHALLHARGLARADGPGTLRIMVTDLPGRFAEVAGRFLGRDIDAAAVEQIDL